MKIKQSRKRDEVIAFPRKTREGIDKIMTSARCARCQPAYKRFLEIFSFRVFILSCQKPVVDDHPTDTLDLFLHTSRNVSICISTP